MNKTDHSSHANLNGRNLYLSKQGICDFGSNEGYSPLDLVMTASGFLLEDALD
jgi:hypothetical protein